MYGDLDEEIVTERGYELVNSDTELWDDEEGNGEDEKKRCRGSTDDISDLTRESWEVSYQIGFIICHKLDRNFFPLYEISTGIFFINYFTYVSFSVRFIFFLSIASFDNFFFEISNRLNFFSFLEFLMAAIYFTFFFSGLFC